MAIEHVPMKNVIAPEGVSESWSYDSQVGATMKVAFVLEMRNPDHEGRIGWNGDKAVYFFEARVMEDDLRVGLTYETPHIRKLIEFVEADYADVDDQTFKRLFWAGG